MSLILKRGKVTDIHVSIGKYFKSANNTLSLTPFMIEKELNHSITFEDEEEFMIIFLLNPEKKGDKSKKKENALENDMENPRKAMEDVLGKYAFSTNSTKKESATSNIPKGFVKKLRLIYANASNHKKVFSMIDNRARKDDIKTIILIEGVVDYVVAQELKNHGKQKKQLLQSNLEQFSFTSKSPQKDEPFFENKQELDDYLVSLSLNADLDYKLVESKEESLKFIESTITSLIETNNRSSTSYFDTKTQSSSNISIYSGFEDMYSLMWIEMMMTIPGISEEKAVALAKKYPTVKSLMEEIKKNPGKLDLFMDIEVVHNFDTSKKRNLGKITSSKLVKAFASKDPEELI